MNQNFNVIKTEHGLIKAWTKGVEFEEEALRQTQNIANLPFIHKHVSIMPDVHSGKGATVGSVIPTLKAIIPAAAGVDLGCGMCALKTSLKADDLPSSLSAIRSEIERAIPHGRTDNGGPNDRGAWRNVPQHIEDQYQKLFNSFPKHTLEKYPSLFKRTNTSNHLGSLGSGNHFVEICLDLQNNVWFMLHSGSRGIGNRIGSHFIELAKKDMEKWFIHLPDSDLAYLPEGSEHFNHYTGAVSWAQKFAMLNRQIMMQNMIDAVRNHIDIPFTTDELVVNCHHNYISQERHFGEDIWVTRKGAVSAQNGEFGIIPGSMGAKSFIVRGKGNHESFCSCSHGAGRRMSRAEAKRRFTIDDHIVATSGVECRKDHDVIDETPAAYKSIDDVMAAQSDLVDVVHVLKQILCVKG